jgi:hypothetical protein
MLCLVLQRLPDTASRDPSACKAIVGISKGMVHVSSRATNAGFMSALANTLALCRIHEKRDSKLRNSAQLGLVSILGHPLLHPMQEKSDGVSKELVALVCDVLRSSRADIPALYQAHLEEGEQLDEVAKDYELLEHVASENMGRALYNIIMWTGPSIFPLVLQYVSFM